MSNTIDLSNILKDDVPTLESWVSEQEYEYSRTASEVVDYLNAVIDYDTVDNALFEYNAGTDLVEWGSVLEECGIEPESDKAAVARTHITSYFDARSK